MEEETEKTNVKSEAIVDDEAPRKVRSRKKLLRTTLKKQMEFYFSDANLSRDRFTSELLNASKSGIDVSVFLTYNRIKSLTSDVKDIVKAVEKSDFLKLTDCKTKIYRATPYKEKTNIEECTIYVENIPADVDNNFLLDIFEVYGPIDYISIPRFTHSKKNKGFGFVEFKIPEDAKKAISTFASLGNCLSNQIEPGQLCSVLSYIEENKKNESSKSNSWKKSNEKGNNKKHDKIAGDNVDNSEQCKEAVTNNNSDKESTTSNSDVFRKPVCVKDEPSVSDNSDENVDSNHDFTKKGNASLNKNSEQEKLHKKRRNAENENEISAKKAKVDSSSDEKSQSVDHESKKRKRRVSDGNEQLPEKPKQSKENDFSSEDEANKTSKRKAPNKEVDRLCNTATVEDSESCSENQKPDDEGEEMTEDIESRNCEEKKRKRIRKNKKKKEKLCMGLNILPKSEWKSLRNKYLDEQRRKMQSLKKQLQANWWNYRNRYEQYPPGNVTEQTVKSNNVSEEDIKDKHDAKKLKGKKLSFDPHLIVKLTMEEPIINIASFKNEAKLHPGVLYTDIKEGSTVAYLRFSTAENAEQFSQTSPWPGATILSGSDEQAYWDKVWKDRKEKIEKNIRRPKKGRQKLLQKADDIRVKHVNFHKADDICVNRNHKRFDD